MHETLFLSYPPRMQEKADLLSPLLQKKGYPTAMTDPGNLEGNLVLLFFDMDSTPEEIYDCSPWLKEQFDYSSLKALRLMPFLFYESSKGSVEEQVDEYLADTLEEVISGEFKPYGFDLDAEDPLLEFDSVYETYEE